MDTPAIAKVINCNGLRGSPVVHVFGVADIDVAAVLFGGSGAVPSRQRRDDVTGNVGIAAQEAHGSQEEKRTKQPTHPYPLCMRIERSPVAGCSYSLSSRGRGSLWVEFTYV